MIVSKNNEIKFIIFALSFRDSLIHLPSQLADASSVFFNIIFVTIII